MFRLRLRQLFKLLTTSYACLMSNSSKKQLKMNLDKLDLLSEKLRPQSVQDCVLSDRLMGKLLQMESRQAPIMNMMFYGAPGLGKSTVARALVNGASDEISSMFVNGSKTTGMRAVDDIAHFANTVSFSGQTKVCVVDEADYLKDEAQAAMRSLIEQVQSNCRFIFTLNELKRMIPALRSRLIPVCFDLTLDEMRSASERYSDRISRLLPKLGMRVDDSNLGSIIRAHFPDYRAIANNIEFACH